MTQERLLGVAGQNEIKHRPGVYLITVDDHVNQWGSINLDQDGEYAPVWHRECNMSKKSDELRSSMPATESNPHIE